MENPDQVRKALVEGYLYEYRYLGTEDQQNNLTQYYRRVFGSKAMGKRAQSIQSFILGPLIYKGKPDVKTQAAKLYDELFDMPIQRGERQAITKALSATYNRDEVTAGLMNVGIRNVEIVDQNIRSDDRGDYAIIEIEESYKNLTFGPQEIFYYFSLPEDAVMTGIWIGQTRDRVEMDTYIVAPRGAAQKVYEQQVRQRIDPALLEQVGPGQYRLRVFPIPVSRLRNSMVWEARERRNVENMNVHMRYVVPRSPEGFALPVLSEKRNVDWSRKTQRRLNGKPVKAKDWMPIRFIKAAGTGPVNLTSKLSGQTVSVKSLEGSIEQPPIGRFAVLVDTSKSMEAYKTDLGLAFKTIETWRQNGSDIRIILTDKRPYEGPDMAVPFFGNKTPSDILQRFQAQEQIPYDAVILLTDKGRYARSPEDENLAISAQNPIWVWHLGPAPSAIDDNLLDAIYSSGGGMAGSAADLAAGLTYGGYGQRVQNGRLWTLGGQGEGEAMKDSALTSLAARQVILQGSFGTKPDNAALDEFHHLAKTYDVVSPYSSMIVLVNDRQREALKKASEAEDRFDREGRSGEENLTSPNSPLVSAVPEPHEWLLIIVSVLLLLWLWRRERNTASSFA